MNKHYMVNYMVNLRTEMTSAPLLVKILLCFFMVLIHVQGSKACLEKERLGLMEIIDFFGVAHDMEANCCGWRYVHCDHTTGRVTDLILEQSLIDKESSSTPMNFSLLHPFEQLERLDLSNNYFNGSVEIEGLCGLKNLQELDISHNSIDSLPECMGNLTSLRVLDLSSTSMTGNVPSFISTLKSLEYISLFDTKTDGFFSFSLLANHSKLEVFRLSSIADNLHVETESHPWLPTFQLKVLQLENCRLNIKQSSVIPSFLQYQHELRIIDLSRNKLQGDFPSWILNNNAKLETLLLNDNSFTGSLQLPTSIHGLLHLRISSNKFGGQLPESIGEIFPNISYIDLAKNNFVGSFPSSMVELRRLQILELSENKLSGELARDFFSNWTSLELLNLSHNSFSGQVTLKFANSQKLKYLYLNNNKFSGEIDYEGLNMSSLTAIDISSNMISGRIPRSWIGHFASLDSLSMSKNLLEGEVPFEICNQEYLNYLDLSENNLSGSLPNCFSRMNCLTYLHLQKNALNGYLPNGLFGSLYLVDLRDNHFSGDIPFMGFSIGNRTISNILLLGGNQLSGSIPGHLCYLTHLRILDLSRNRLTGTIPSCLDDILFKYDSCSSSSYYFECVQHPLLDTYSSITYSEYYNTQYNSTLTLSYNSPDDYIYTIPHPQLAEFRTKNNLYSYTGSILGLMSGLDLSSNELSGSIPPEIGNIEGIFALNLSHNRLSGSIPRSLSNLVSVESLDLSYNNLSGEIPSNLTALGFLEIFNVSYNNLSGPTPTTGQFANFNEDNYRGNPGLFGPFLNGSSNRTLSPPLPPSEIPSNEGGENQTAIELVSFYWGFVSSYVTVVLGLTIILWFSPRWCRVWFRFVDLCIYYCFPCFFRNGFRYASSSK